MPTCSFEIEVENDSIGDAIFIVNEYFIPHEGLYMIVTIDNTQYECEVVDKAWEVKQIR
jgi:hypothetical protein